MGNPLLKNLLLTALGSAMGLCAQTYVVDAQGGGNFLDLPQAVATVPSGAVLHVRPGAYSAFSLANKSLSILGDDPNSVLVDMGLTSLVIGPTTATDRVLIQNLHLKTLVFGSGILVIRDAAGQTLLDRVSFDIAPTAVFGSDQRIQVERSANVHLFGCGFGPTTSQGNGFGKIDVVDSWIELRACTAIGNPCSSNTFVAANPGLWLHHSIAFSVGCNFTGGVGGPAGGCGLPSPGPSNGGPGVRVDGGSALHSVRDTVNGGVGGSGIACRPGGAQGGNGIQVDASSFRGIGSGITAGAGGSTGGLPGTQIVATGGAIVDFPLVPSLVANLKGVPVPGMPITLSLSARAGDTAILMLAYDQVFLPVPPLVTTGALLVAPAVVLGPFTIATGGVLDVPLALPLTWPRDQWIPFQFLAAPPSLQEVWASNSVGILAR